MSQQEMKQLVYSPFLLAKRVIKDDSNYHSIRIPYLCLLTQKVSTNKEKRLNRLKNRIIKHIQTNNLPGDLLILVDKLSKDRDFAAMILLADEVGLATKTYKYSK